MQAAGLHSRHLLRLKPLSLKTDSVQPAALTGIGCVHVIQLSQNHVLPVGSDAYMPGYYGPTITIERKASAAGASTYTIYDHSGRKVTQQHTCLMPCSRQKGDGQPSMADSPLGLSAPVLVGMAMPDMSP